MANQKQMAKLVLGLINNVDEAEQFSSHIAGLVLNCRKSYLLKMLSSLKDSVEFNIKENRGRYLINTKDELDVLLKQVDKVLKSERV